MSAWLPEYAETIVRVSDEGEVSAADLHSLPRLVATDEGWVSIESSSDGMTNVSAYPSEGGASAIFRCVGDVSASARVGNHIALAGRASRGIPTTAMWVRLIDLAGRTVGAATIATANGTYVRTQCEPSDIGEASGTIQLIESCRTFFQAVSVNLPGVVGLKLVP